MSCFRFFGGTLPEGDVQDHLWPREMISCCTYLTFSFHSSHRVCATLRYFYLSVWNFKNCITVQISTSGSFQLLHCQTSGQGLLPFLRLLVCDDQGVKVSVASNFKLHVILFLDLDRFGILPPGSEQEVLDCLNFTRPGSEAWLAPRNSPYTSHTLRHTHSQH